MKTFFIVLLFFLAAVLEIAAVPFLSFGGANLNLVLVLFLLFTVFKTFKKTWWQIVLIGLFLDFFSGLPFGTISFSLVFAISIIDWLKRNIFSEVKLWITISLVALGTLLYYFSLTSFSKVLSFWGQGQPISYFHFSFEFFALTLVGIGLNLLAAIVFYKFFSKWA